MKTEQQIRHARGVLAMRIEKERANLTPIQFVLLQGMLNALVWASDAPNSDIVQRILNGEPFATTPPSPE